MCFSRSEKRLDSITKDLNDVGLKVSNDHSQDIPIKTVFAEVGLFSKTASRSRRASDSLDEDVYYEVSEIRTFPDDLSPAASTSNSPHQNLSLRKLNLFLEISSKEQYEEKPEDKQQELFNEKMRSAR